ncbi:MAG: hypothetical protein LBP26_06680 [Clostridiales bacterium]|jgi:hypothetical protein|nr:hypothetical protein [Clostridiales bacterium]
MNSETIKNFEEGFDKIITAMVSECWNYADKKCDAIYIHCTIYDVNTIGVSFFYRVKNKLISNDRIVEKKRVRERLEIVWDLLSQNTIELAKLFEANKDEIPFEIRIIYDFAQKVKLNVKFVYDNEKNVDSLELLMKWEDEINTYGRK